MTHNTDIPGKSVIKINIWCYDIAKRHNCTLCSPQFSGKCVMTQKQRSADKR
jgi:hypothetical protein